MTSIAVTVDDARARVGRSNWGQRAFWTATQRLGSEAAAMNAAVALPLDSLDLDHVLRCVRRLVTRFDVLRTTFEESDEVLYQRVAGSGRLTVEVLDATVAAVHDLSEQLRSRPFCLATEWPIRFGVVVASGRAVGLAVAIPRVAMDFGAVQVVGAEMTRLLAGGGPLPPAEFEPVDLAGLEADEAHRELNARACDHARHVLGGAAPSLFDYPPGPVPDVAFPRYTLTSPALWPAVSMVAAAWRVSTSAVLLAATAVVLGRYTGHRVVCLSAIAGNRPAGPRRQLVGTVSMNAFLAVDTAGPAFRDVVAAAFQASIEAYLHAYYDIDAMAAMQDALEVAVGARIDRSAYFNDARLLAPPAPEPLAAAELRGLSASGRIHPEPGPAKADLKVHLTVNDAPDGISLTIMGDAAYLPERVMHGLLHGIERLLVDAAVGEATIGGGLAPVVRGPDWVDCGNGWADLPATEAVWRTVAGATAAVLPGPDGLVGWCSGDVPIATLHRSMVEAIRDRVDVRTPVRYVRCATAPLAPADAAVWQSLPVVERGSRR
jgi:hypothetical protein